MEGARTRVTGIGVSAGFEVAEPDWLELKSIETDDELAIATADNLCEGLPQGQQGVPVRLSLAGCLTVCRTWYHCS